MTLRLLITLNLLLLAAMAAGAQTAGDFFDSGAQLYISNNIPAALDKTEKGLKLYPDDVKLKKLEELLKQQQQSQSQSQQNQQNQQNQSQQNQSQQNQSQQQQSQQNQNSSQAKNQQQNQQQQNQHNQNQAGQSGQQNPQQQAQAQQKAAADNNEQGNVMTPEEAKRLLDAQKDSEQFLQMTPKGNPQNENQAIKDW